MAKCLSYFVFALESIFKLESEEQTEQGSGTKIVEEIMNAF